MRRGSAGRGIIGWTGWIGIIWVMIIPVGGMLRRIGERRGNVRDASVVLQIGKRRPFTDFDNHIKDIMISKP